MKNLAFIIHGKVTHRDRLVNELKNIFKGDYTLQFLYTEHKDHSIELATHAVVNDATHVICVGGDGSLNEVANGIMQVRNENVRMGALPNGTGNDFVKTMQVTNNINDLKKYIDADSYREIDLGLVQFMGIDGKTSQRYFINITDVGMGGVVAEKLSSASKWMGATVKYQKAILSTLLTYKNQSLKATADNFTHHGKVMNFIVANGKYFGSGMGIAPDAKPDDGLFSIVIVGEISMLDYLKNLGTVKKCQRIVHPELKYLSAAEVLVEATAEPLAIDMDGEFIGYSPMKIIVVPKAIKFLSAL
jgi:YegS/Rv2252/BmrU family lipid kinase